MKKFAFFLFIGLMVAWAYGQASNSVKVTFVMNKTLPPSYTFSTDFAGEISQCLWSFGDGKNSELKNPTHTFAVSGSYLVQVKILDKAGVVWFGSLKESFQGEKEPPLSSCKANFTSETVILEGTPYSKVVAFTNSSTGGTRECKWTFGDGTTSFETNPKHQFTAYGEFRVCLLNITPDNCRSEICMTIKVQGPSNTPVILSGKGYVKDKTGLDGCGFVVALENGTIVLPIEVVPPFTFREGQFVEIAYEVLPNAPNLCMAGKQVKIHKIFEITPPAPVCKAYFTATNQIWSDLTQMKKVVFANLSAGDIKNCSWNFGDGTTSNEIKPIHEYKEYGEYRVCLIIETVSGCKSDYCTTVVVKAPATDGACYFDLVAKPKELSPNTFVFYALSRTEITGWKWSFGDETTSTLQNPEHTYAKPGSYIVTCTITTTSGCTQTKKITLNIQPPPLPVCQGAISLLLFNPTGNTCNGKAVVKLMENETKEYEGVTYAWSTGATGSMAGDLCPDKNYIVQAVVKDVCQKTTSFAFLSKPLWKVAASSGKYTFIVEAPVADVVYRWDFGDGKVAYGTTVDYNYEADGVYNVTLTAMNGAITSDESKEVTYLKSLTGSVDPVKKQWEVFPNPAGDLLRIATGTMASDNLNVEILDMKGGIAKAERFTGILAPYVEISISSLPDGIYFVRLNDGSQFHSGIKFIKKK